MYSPPGLGHRAVPHTPTSAERDYLQALGRNVQAARRAAGLTQLATATAAQLSLQKYGNVERGAVAPTVLTLRAIAIALGVSADDLLPKLGS